MKHLPPVNGERILIEIKRVVDSGLDGPVHRVGTVDRPVVPFSGIGELDRRDVFDILVTVFKGDDQTKWKAVVLGKRISVHPENK